MELTVKATKVVKTGKNKSGEGEWELIVVTSEDNTDYTTFDKKAKHLTSGAVIDIGEPIIKEGKISFKEFKVISEGASKPSPDEGEGKQLSIESQKRADIIAQLWIAGKLKDTDKLVAQMRNWLGDKLVETKGKEIEIKAPPTSSLQAEKDTEELWPDVAAPIIEAPTQESEQEPESIPKTIQALYNWISSHGKEFTRSWFLKNFSYTEEELKEESKVIDAYHEVKQMMNW